MNHTTKVSLIVIGIAALGIVALGASRQLGVRAPQKAPETSIKIGVLAPLSGDLSLLGQRMVNAMELAKADILAEDNSQPIEIIYEDVCIAPQAVSAVRKLLDVDKVSMIGGSFCLAGEVSVLPVTEANKIIIFNTAANPDSVLNKQYAFSTNFSIKNDSQALVEYARTKLGAKTASIVHLQTPFGQDYNQYITQYFEEAGGKVLSHDAKTIDARDFRTELTKIKSLNPDVIFIIHFSNPQGLFLKQAKELGIESAMIGDYESEDPTIVTAAGNAADGLIFGSTDIDPAFAAKYKERYGADPDVIAANAYDAIRLQVMVYKQCNGNPDCMAAKLHDVKDYPGASGTLTIEPDGSTKKPFIFKKFENGQFVTVQE